MRERISIETQRGNKSESQLRYRADKIFYAAWNDAYPTFSLNAIRPVQRANDRSETNAVFSSPTPLPLSFCRMISSFAIQRSIMNHGRNSVWSFSKCIRRSGIAVQWKVAASAAQWVSNIIAWITITSTANARRTGGGGGRSRQQKVMCNITLSNQWNPIHPRTIAAIRTTADYSWLAD